jgi:uncharacterized lipoprotein YbaY
MKQKRVWLIALAIVVMLVAACGPQPATPTPKATVGASPTVQAATTPVATTVVQPTATAVPLDLSKLPVDPNDWHALGPADAKVTIVEYSEFM